MNYTKEELITALGIEPLTPEVQEQVLGTFLNTLEIRTGDVVAGLLTDEQLQELNKVVTDKGDEAGDEWLRNAIPSYDDIEEKEMIKLISEINENGKAMTGN